MATSTNRPIPFWELMLWLGVHDFVILHVCICIVKNQDAVIRWEKTENGREGKSFFVSDQKLSYFLISLFCTYFCGEEGRGRENEKWGRFLQSKSVDRRKVRRWLASNSRTNMLSNVEVLFSASQWFRYLNSVLKFISFCFSMHEMQPLSLTKLSWVFSKCIPTVYVSFRQ